VDRPFLDANVLFSAAYQPNNPLLALWRLADTELLASPWVIQEAENALTRARPARLPDLAALLATVSRVPDALPGTAIPAGIQLPDKDQPVLLAALQAQASHLLTGDLKHFGPYFGLTVAGLVILRPAVYLQSRQTP
jgi:uncharacterized protein